MNVQLFFGVLRRDKRLVVAGLVLAAVLAVLAYGQPSFSHGLPTLVPRSAEVWQSQAELMLTLPSDPWGRGAPQYTPGKSNAPPIPLGDQTYMENLAPIYAQVANGSTIQAEIFKTARVPDTAGTVKAAEVPNLVTGSDLPFITLTSSAPTSNDAIKLATGAATTLQTTVEDQQVAAAIPAGQRLILQPVLTGDKVQLVQGPKLSIPILVFVALLAATIALVFIRENIRRPRKALESVGDLHDVGDPAEADTWAEPARARVGAADRFPRQAADSGSRGTAFRPAIHSPWRSTRTGSSTRSDDAVGESP